MTLNNFNPSKEQMARAKVLLSDDLKEILTQLENGLFLVSAGISNVFVGEIKPDAQIIMRVTTRNIRTLKKAGLVKMVKNEFYSEWVLAYDPKITSIKDVK